MISVSLDENSQKREVLVKFLFDLMKTHIREKSYMLVRFLF